MNVGDIVTPVALPWYFFLFTALASAIVGGLVAGPILELLIHLKSRQTISQHLPEHAAKQGTPTMGGLIVAVGFLAGIIYTFIQLRGLPVAAAYRYYGSVAALFVCFAAIGFVDDYVVPRKIKGKRGLGWMQKLIMEAIAGLVFVIILGRPMPVFNEIAGVFIILFFANAYNFSDGLDALAGSILLTIVVGLTMAATGRIESGLYPVLAALVGGVIPFLWLNVPPAKVFMGDVGSLPVGAVLGACACTLLMPTWSVAMVHSEDPGFIPSAGLGITATWPVYLGMVLISGVMLIELVPVPLQILSVKLFKRRIFPPTPIHHAFQRAGWKEPKIVALFAGVQLALSLVGGYMVLRTKPDLKPPSTLPKRGPSFRRPHTAPGHQPKPMYDPDLPNPNRHA